MNSFLTTWRGSAGNERANFQSFLRDFCAALDLPAAEILERLVALNQKRAAEEARGLIRYLRPEYQAPAQVLAPKPMLEEETEQPAGAGTAIPLEPQTWPKDLKAQLAALRDLLRSSARLWSLETLAQAFKSRGSYRESLAHHLDLLTDLGIVSRVEAPEGLRWHRPQAMGA